MKAGARNPEAPRFEAEWIEKQFTDERGDWDPDRDEYCFTTLATLEAAQAEAIRRSKKAGAVEWVRVCESHFDPSLGISPRSEAAWDNVRVWTGDWEGNWEESR